MTLRNVAILGLFLLMPAALVHANEDGVIAAWVQYTVDGVEARVVSTGDCPRVRIDGRTVEMWERAQPTYAHPNTVCAAEIPAGTRSIRVSGKRLPAPTRKRTRRIVVMGDTGCRLSASHGLYQECNNNSLWPFARVARSVAAAAPDAIIYTGDYIYREDECPEGDNGCKGSPSGDNQKTWEADWLVPAAPVHASAPLVLIRGNHETCKRSGTGWFRYLDARPLPAECEDSTDPWVVDLGAVQVGVMDVANTKDQNGEPLDWLFAQQLDELDRVLTKRSWIATHRPFWGFGADDDTGELTQPTEVLQDAVREAGLPQTTHFLIGAHIHLAEVLDFGGKRPPQLVAANGGTQLVPYVDPPEKIDGVAIRSSTVIYQYGFVVMDREGRNHWSISFRDIEGRELERCRLRGRRVFCPGSPR
jgi:hypothetical protein